MGRVAMQRAASKVQESLRSFLLMLAILLALSFVAQPAFADETTVDGPTADNWAILNYDEEQGRTTKNDGRIWTDKSVYASDATVMADANSFITIEKSENSNFLVGLSTLASTMSVDGVSDRPLDIILVLDVSGSMDDSMGYVEVYSNDMTYQQTYYILQNGRYIELEYSYNRQAWYYERGNNSVWITPKASADDTTPGRLQAYRAASKMDVLADSVKVFVDTTEQTNANISSAADRHRISIVKFSGNIEEDTGNDTYRDNDRNLWNNSQVVYEFATVNARTAAQIDSAIDNLAPAGATRADYGMRVAQGLMSEARDEAQTVVIFFTDGVPTTFSEWSDSVANGAISYAKQMKDAGAWVYCVGVFEDDDPTGNGALGRYMNAVSSNYPKATGFTNNSMGTRVGEDENYYYTADNAEGLAAIFDKIAKEIVGKSAEFPTHVEDGYDADKGGYVTFVDELGDYMKVGTFNSVVLNGIEYKNQITEQNWADADASTDVFVSNQMVTNDLGEEVSIGSVLVTIQRFNDARTGDIVTVKIPAALVPLAYYKVVVEDGLATTERIPTTPIRAFYEVSLKDEARDLLVSPDEDMIDYLSTNLGDDGKAVFYSNAYDASENAEIGSAVANFVPSATNDMYFATEDTPIFTNPECTIPVTRINESATYYYQRVYYVVGENREPQFELVAFPASLLRSANYVFNNDGQLVVKAGTARSTRADATDTIKAQSANKTSTAAKAAAPRWDDWYVSGSDISVFLGNNGLLATEVPGVLAISKNVVVPEWSKVNVSDKQFTFEVVLKDYDDAPIQGTFAAQVKNSEGQNVGNAFSVVTDSEGRASVSLKDGQTLYIYNLADGVGYTIRETELPYGFRQTAPADEVGQPMNANGVVSAGETSVAAFENTYSAIGTLVGETYLDGTKTLTGRDWRDNDVFAFALAPENPDNPMPANAELVDGVCMSVTTVSGKDADKAFSFGDITYTEPGTYLYDINEVIMEGTAGRIPGISYSQSIYEVTVVVSDNGDGTLRAESTMKLFGSGQSVAKADFVNAFVMEQVTFGFEGLKYLEDTTGSYELKDDVFAFQMTALTDGAPMPEGTVNGVYTTTNKGLSVSFGPFTHRLSEDDFVGIPGGSIVHSYQVKEIAGAIPGMTYDANVYQIDVTFTWDAADGLLFNIDYPGTNSWVTFSNTYKPKEVTVELEGLKILTGRDWTDEDAFTFVLKGLDGAPMPLNDEGVVVDQFTVEKTSNQLNLGIFGFDIVYDKPGTYVYELSEVRGNTGGVVYDDYVSVITVEVTDNGQGALVAEKAVVARTDIEVRNGVSGFLNKYESSMTYPGLTIEKTLLGRDMSFGEFDFEITPDNPNALNRGIAESDASFESGAHEAGETCTMGGKLSGLTFTQDDDGKQFIYEVSEVVPSDDDERHDGVQSQGVTYDTRKYWVVITPKDNGDGTMDAITQVYSDEERMTLLKEWSTADTDAPTVSFENEYGFADVTVDTGAQAFFTKIFEGRDWLDSDTFEFDLSVAEGSEENTPMPEGVENGVASVTVRKPDSGNRAVVDFGELTFTAAGVYKYKVVETVGDLANVTYDTHAAELTVTVTDNGRGTLVASTVVERGTFANSFEESLRYGDVTTLDVTKSLEGRNLRAQQFAFTVEPMDIPSMQKAGMVTLNGMEFRNGAPDQDGVSHMFSPDGLVFTQEDLGITYGYVFAEIDGGLDGYTYDPNVYTLEMTPFYDNGLIKVSTKVTDQTGAVLFDEVGYEGKTDKPVVTIAFENSYDTNAATVDIVGTKTMSGRDLTEGEFGFALVYANDADRTAISTAANDAEGKIAFEQQAYTLGGLADLIEAGYAVKSSDGVVDVYAIAYLAYELAGGGKGVTHTVSSFAFEVVVTDDGEGDLTAEVKYPDGGLAFKNAYSTGGPIFYDVKGLKTLEVPAGLNPDSIEGKFTFTLTAETPGAPMPEVTSVTNDAMGNIDFGSIEFTQDLLEGVDQVGTVRTKEFTYAVTETGEAPGVTNDAETTKRFTLTLTDDGEGNLKVMWLESDPAEGPMFTFANAYDADETTESISGEGNLVIKKTLAGRDLNDGEFTFELVEGDEVVAEGTNNAEGFVTFEAITYTKPGTHAYTVREVQGELGGVTYDETTYQVEAVVADNRKGKLDVEFRILDEGVEEIVFENAYEYGSLALGVAPGKVLEGRQLADGEFEFKMAAVTEGAPMPESDVAVNDADGSVNFGEMTYTEPGTWEYSISEVEGNAEGVTYDDTVYSMKVVVFDSGEGYLDCEVTFNGEENPPIFVNYYKDSSKPTGPDGVKGDDLSQTGDGVFAIARLLGALVVVAGLVCAVAYGMRRRGYRR